MKLIDTHSHLTFEGLENQVDAVLARSVEAGVTRWITVGTDKEQNEKVLRLVSRHENLWADMELLKKQLASECVVAVGECGLDYYYMNSVAENQKPVFRKHLDMASELQKPVIIHTREAFEDTMSILDEYADKLKRVVFHCFGGDAKQTQAVLDRGFYISFTGTVTFKRSDALREVAKMIPLDRLMIETDCPYISPHPVRNIQPNEPALLVHTAQCLANVHEIPLEDFADKITKTSITFFGL
jgi:TatD DNase family protein